MKALRFYAPEDVRLEDVPEPTCGPDEVKLKVIHSSVGGVTESDVMLASASNAIVLGFNVKADPKATSQAQAALRILGDHQVWQRMSDLGAADARARFSLDQIVSKYEHLYKTSLEM